MGTESIDKVAEKYTVESIIRWFVFGVLVVVCLPVFDILDRIITERQINYMECMPDVFLAVISVCCNLLNICADTKKKIPYGLKWTLWIVIAIVGLWYIVTYYRMYYIQRCYETSVLQNWFYLSMSVIIGSLIIGSLIEWNSNRQKKKKDGKKHEEDIC